MYTVKHWANPLVVRVTHLRTIAEVKQLLKALRRSGRKYEIERNGRSVPTPRTT